MASDSTPLILQAAGAGPGGTFEPSEGLSQAEAKKRHEEDGANELEPPPKESFLSILLTQCKNVIFLLTFTAACLNYMLGQKEKAYGYMSIVVIVCLTNAIGEYSAQDAGAALQEMEKRSAGKKLDVKRDGKWTKVPARELVVGDVASVTIGDTVPADMQVLTSNDCHTDEAVLTGEPEDKLKTVVAKDAKANFPSNMMYKTTDVTAGGATAVVTAIGMQTEVGLIAKRLQIDDVTLNVNPLQKSINLLGVYIGKAGFVVIVTATTVAYTTGYQNPVSPCADDDDTCLLLSSIIRGLLMAVSIIPHGLPCVVMIMLMVGAKEMGKLNGLIMRRSAVDYLGACTVICTDKTGTLTEGKMTAEVISSLCRQGASATASETAYEFYPLKGFSPNGGLWASGSIKPGQKKQIDDKFNLAEDRQDFSALIGVEDVADSKLLQAEVTGRESVIAQAHLAAAFLNCYQTQILRNEESGGWKMEGNMSEAALKVAVCKAGLWDASGPGAERWKLHPRQEQLEVPFSSSRKMMCTVHKLPESGRLATIQFPKGSTHVAIVKGAPDRLYNKVAAVPTLEGEVLTVPGGPITEPERQLIVAKNKNLADEALRTLILAVCPLSQEEVQRMEAAAKKEGAEATLTYVLASSNFTYLSMWGLRDPPRAAVPPSVRECHEAGIRVVMITGDQKDTAIAIGKSVGIIEEVDDPEMCASLSSELHEPPGKEQKAVKQTSSRSLVIHDAKGDKDSHEKEYKDREELAEMTNRVNVWSRALPTDKVAIVDSLRSSNHVAAMTGDGVNDAPAMKHADVGTAMGISGTTVTKNAADLILLDDNFTTIVNAVKEGRRIYLNTQKYVTFNLSVKCGECVCALLCIVHGLPLPMRSMQQLANLIVTHIIPTFSLAFEPAEEYIMKVPPRCVEGDLIVGRLMWLLKWFPFVVCFCVSVLSSLSLGIYTHTGYMRGNALIGSSRVGKLEAGLSACEFAGDLDEEGHLIEDAAPFHCSCQLHRHGFPWESAVTVENWGRRVSTAELEANFNRWNGDSGDLFDQENTPWKSGREALVQPCLDHRGVNRWCWKQMNTAEDLLPLLPQGMHCAAYGTQIGQSMSYVTVHMGEILSLMTYRTDGPCVLFLFTNPVYLGMFAFNLTMLCIFLYSPANRIMGLAPLTAPRFAMAASFAVLLMILNELVKIVYRRQLKIQNETLSAESQDRVRPHRAVKGPEKA